MFSEPNSDSGGPSSRPASLGEDLLELSERLRALFARAASAEGLTYMEARTLRTALRFGHQTDLVAALRVAPSNASATLRALERRGLIARPVRRGDRRHRLVEITVDGQRVLERLFARLDATSPLVTSLSAEQAANLRSIVTHLLERLDPPDAPG